MKNTLKTIIVLIILIIIVAIVIKIKPQPGAVNTGNNSSLLATVDYSCNLGKSINAAFYSDGSTKPQPTDDRPAPTGSAHITLSDGRTMTLSQTISADGARYANDDESFVFWSKGNGALVLENNVEKSYIGCIAVKPAPEGVNLPAMYSNSAQGFSLRLPSFATSTTGKSVNDYSVTENYTYNVTPGKSIHGVKFTIPTNMATGTNLSSDSYISVEEIPNSTSCAATNFIDRVTPKTITENDMTYDVASSTDAAAGNRYQQIVYALPGTNPCVAVRYFIHYGVFENYPAGSIKEFDQAALLKEFDAIRSTLVINQ